MRQKTVEMTFQESITIRHSLYHCVLIAVLIVFAQDLSSRGKAHAWTYTYNISQNRSWNAARKWCQDNFIDMVTAQNQEEMDFLNNLLPFYVRYYWIGVRKVNGAWSWPGLNKDVPKEAENWAVGEPDNFKDQDCVEIYIKKERDTAKWNNERCTKKKGTVCYTVSCTKDSCSDHADCVETVGNYTCQCHPGFTGPLCDETISCQPLSAPQQGSYNCFDPYGSNRFNSSCQFHCELGFQLVGAPELLCQATGHWNQPFPLCEVDQCPVLNHTSISGGQINCSHPIAPYSYNSTCDFMCDEGYELSGQGHIRCDQSGRWTASIPTCAIKKCDSIYFPVTGDMKCVDTLEPFSFGSQCNFTCQEGYYLSGDSTLTCLASGMWSYPTPTCTVVQCNSLKAPLAASVHCQHPLGLYSYDSVCIVQCEEGFDPIGPNVTRCSSRGNWSHALPVCQAKRCPTLNAATYGSIFCSNPHGDFSFRSQCTSGCDEGFVLNGTADIECTSQGIWSGEIPHCQARLCPLLVDTPQHGRMSCSNPYSPFSYGSQCDFACEEGFSLRGQPAVTCNSSGHWSQDLPTCQLNQCAPIQASSLLSMNCSHPLGNFSFGSQCFFTCKDGFSLNGTAVLLCSSTGFWSDSLPTCTAWPAGTAMLLYTGVGAASVVILIVLIGLALLILIKFRKRGNKLMSEEPALGDRENPAFEF